MVDNIKISKTIRILPFSKVESEYGYPSDVVDELVDDGELTALKTPGKETFFFKDELDQVSLKSQRKG